MEYNSLDQYMHCISVNLRKNKLQFIRLVPSDNQIYKR